VFLSAIEGNEVEVTNKNVDGLSALCEEFQFWSLLGRVLAFKETPTYQIRRQNARIEAVEKQFEELSQHFQAQEASLEAAVVRLSQAEVNVTQLAADVRTLQSWQESAAKAQDGLEQAMRTVTTNVGGLNSAVSCLGVAQFQSWATGLDSAIISGLPFSEFSGKRFSLLWRGGRDGFGGRDFHGRCDGHANTLTLIEDTNGNIFGGFTPVEWESRVWNRKNGNEDNGWKADETLKSFIFTLKNPHNVPARTFALNAERKDQAIYCASNFGPSFGGVVVVNDCNANTRNYTQYFGISYTNDTGLGGKSPNCTFFTGSKNFQVKEIEVFEITD
jgi:hypothetical protein